MGDLPVFWTSENWDGLWYYVRWFIYLGAPLIFTIIVLDNIELLVAMIRRFFKKSVDDDKDDHDIYYY